MKCVPRLLAAIVIALALLELTYAQAPTYRRTLIHNDTLRLDNNGEIVDAHDGNLQFFNGTYYLYGTSYGRTAGYSINNRFRVYSSSDLQHWQYQGELLKQPADGVYYRPYVVYNASTRKYVLWYNWYPKLWNGQVGVATSDSPVGPFIIANPNIKLAKAADHPGDGSLFVDYDHIAYFIYSVIGLDHSIFVERLSKDYLSSTGEVSSPLAKGCEAPALLRRKNTYYALFDTTCCFCKEGSGARVYISSSPFGPYTETNNINRDGSGSPVIAGQQTFVTSIPTADGPEFIWMADRWGSRPDHIKGHDFQYWLPLRFAADGSIMPLKPAAEWAVNAALGRAIPSRNKLYSWPKKPDPHPIARDVCSGSPLSPVEAGIVVAEE